MTVNGPGVKGSRRYSSPTRERQRLSTRAAICTAAADLFTTLGYDATTIGAVAKAAGVSAQTIYDAFGTKARLLAETARSAVIPPTDMTPFDSWFEKLSAENDQTRRWLLLREATAMTLVQSLPMALVVRAAAGSHPEIGELWRSMEGERRRDVEMVVELLNQVGPLRVPRRDAVDLIWAIGRSTDLYATLTKDLKWPPGKAFAAVSDAIASAILERPPEPPTSLDSKGAQDGLG
jgi:AcrR family transcriptional regulator